jgi:hypothetical protein
MAAILSEGLGYGIGMCVWPRISTNTTFKLWRYNLTCIPSFVSLLVLGFGLVFAAIMTLITMIQKRFLGEKVTSEEYMAAGRSVKTGLVASAVVSSWTWAATLLQSSSVAYKYGISGPFWYASGASVQVKSMEDHATHVEME